MCYYNTMCDVSLTSAIVKAIMTNRPKTGTVIYSINRSWKGKDFGVEVGVAEECVVVEYLDPVLVVLTDIPVVCDGVVVREVCECVMGG